MHPNGKVYLVGSGPGDPELLTIKALRLIKEADVIVYDQLPGPGILASLPKSAELIDVGKYAGDHTLLQDEINRLLVDYASQGKAVPAYAGIPITHRDHASMVTIITGHEQKKAGSMLDWEWLAQSMGTIVILMGVSTLGTYIPELMRYGSDPDTPVAIIERGTRDDQVVTTGSLSTIVGIAKDRGVKAPAIVVIGDVVRLHEALGSSG
jgi:uroporphyrin-III C-methyltransferase